VFFYVAFIVVSWRNCSVFRNCSVWIGKRLPVCQVGSSWT